MKTPKKVLMKKLEKKIGSKKEVDDECIEMMKKWHELNNR